MLDIIILICVVVHLRARRFLLEIHRTLGGLPAHEFLRGADIIVLTTRFVILDFLAHLADVCLELAIVGEVQIVMVDIHGDLIILLNIVLAFATIG